MASPHPASVLLTGVVGAALSAGALAVLRRLPRTDRFDRTNHAGRVVTLLEGPAYVLGAGAAGSLGGPVAVVAALGAGGFGAVDDLAGDSRSKGLKGHLGALRRGEVTTGAVKIVGLAVTGLATAALADRRRLGSPGPAATLLGGAVVAGSANLANLLDLRPGRALKATALGAAPLLLGDRDAALTAAAALGAAVGLLPEDLAGRTMLGDTGANAAGALLGAALVQRCGVRGRLVGVGLLAALTLASEKVSFTAVIESTPGLRELDRLGRRG